MKSDSRRTIAFVEGKGGKNFLNHLVEQNGIQMIELYRLAGKPNWKSRLETQRNLLDENSLTGGRNLIIVDADNEIPDQLRKKNRTKQPT